MKKVPTVAMHSYPAGWPWVRMLWFITKRRLWTKRLSVNKAIKSGFKVHGISVKHAPPRKSTTADVAVVWGWKKTALIQEVLARGNHVLVMELGYLQPRRDWVSLTFDGFNNRGKFAPSVDGGARWEQYFGHLMKPWRSDGDYVLLIGQVPGDSALNGTDNQIWLHEQASILLAQGHKVLFRPHPTAPYLPCPVGALQSTNSLADDLAGAEFVVAFSSTTAVESVLAGIPTVVFDEGSVAYPMCSHNLDEPLIRPDRTQWAHDLAWRQWTFEELASGAAWAHISKVLDQSKL